MARKQRRLWAMVVANQKPCQEGPPMMEVAPTKWAVPWSVENLLQSTVAVQIAEETEQILGDA